MSEIKIKGISDDLIIKLTAISKQKGFRNRSKFLISVLNDYVVFGDSLYIRQLPNTTKILVDNVLSEDSEKLKTVLDYSLKVIEKNTEILSKIYDILIE